MPQLIGFSAIESPNTRLLILGSFPSTVSLAQNEYYANPQNRFWSVLGAIANFDRDSNYHARLSALRSRGIALWDVLAACEREGAADAAIVPGSERPNNFGEFVARHPRLSCIQFNGQKAEKMFAEHVLPYDGLALQALTRPALKSTSPANAAFGLPAFQAEWGAAIAECAGA